MLNFKDTLIMHKHIIILFICCVAIFIYISFHILSKEITVEEYQTIYKINKVVTDAGKSNASNLSATILIGSPWDNEYNIYLDTKTVTLIRKEMNLLLLDSRITRNEFNSFCDFIEKICDEQNGIKAKADKEKLISDMKREN